MTSSAPVASLPMYDWPEVRWAHDAVWAAIRDRLRAGGATAPDALERTRPAEEVWLDPGLVLSQTCGWPYSNRLRDQVRLVGTPIYAVEGCEGPLYSSAIIARREDAGQGLASLARRRIAFNAADSLSGFVAPRTAMRAEGVDPAAGEWIETGSHRASIRAVAEGEADLAAIDAVCWALARDFEADATSQGAVIGWTPLRPGLPLVTAGERSEAETERLRFAVADALADPGLGEACAVLRLAGVEEPDEPGYRAIASINA